jgi:hypothetical protein
MSCVSNGSAAKRDPPEAKLAPVRGKNPKGDFLWDPLTVYTLDYFIAKRIVYSHMNEELIQDLKQFIAGTVSQATAGLATKEDLQAGLGDVRTELSELRADMLRRFDELETKVDTIADAHSETLAEHDQRLRRLEQQSA